MKIKVFVTINDSLIENTLELQLPEDIITLHSIEQLVSDFVTDRLIKAGYPK